MFKCNLVKCSFWHKYRDFFTAEFEFMLIYINKVSKVFIFVFFYPGFELDIKNPDISLILVWTTIFVKSCPCFSHGLE